MLRDRHPVTALIIRRVKSGHEEQLSAKVANILSQARQAKGFLGSSVLLGRQASHTLQYVVLHFQDRSTWEDWRNAAEAGPLLKDALQHVSTTPEVRLAEGFAAWFDLPASPLPFVPPKWKMAIITWLAIFPILSVFLTGTAPLMGDFHPIGRLFLNTLIIVPLMTWFVMPVMTRMFHQWLFKTNKSRVEAGAL